MITIDANINISFSKGKWKLLLCFLPERLKKQLILFLVLMKTGQSNTIFKCWNILQNFLYFFPLLWWESMYVIIWGFKKFTFKDDNIDSATTAIWRLDILWPISRWKQWKNKPKAPKSWLSTYSVSI